MFRFDVFIAWSYNSGHLPATTKLKREQSSRKKQFGND
jgi:hypothetical protein